MSVSLKSEALNNEVRMTAITDPKFKTNRLSFNFVMPLNKEKASANAMIPFLMRKGYPGCNSYTLLNQKLNALYGATLVTDVMKYGDYQIANIAVSVIDDQYALNGEPIVNEAIDMLLELIIDPYFLQQDFDLKQFDVEKQQLIDAIEADINDKTTYAVQRLVVHMCEGDAYSTHRYGDVDSIRALEIDDVRRAYDDMMKHAQIEVFYVGCGDSDRITGIINKKLNRLSREPLSSSLLSKKISPFADAKTVTERYDVRQAKLSMGFTVTSDSQEQIDQNRLMCTLLGGTPRSKLFLNVRERLSLCYYCSARLERTKDIMFVNSGVEFENIEAARAEILNQIAELQRGNFTEHELEETKLMIADSFKTVNDSPSSIENWYLAQKFFSLSAKPEEEADRLCKVTKQQVVEAANRVKLATVYVLCGEEEQK